MEPALTLVPSDSHADRLQSRGAFDFTIGLQLGRAMGQIDCCLAEGRADLAGPVTVALEQRIAELPDYLQEAAQPRILQIRNAIARVTASRVRGS